MNEILNKTLVTGGNGAMASYVDFGMKTTRADFDITNMEQVFSYITKSQPKVILHLAAETDLNKCEKDSEHAYMVNAVGTYNLAMAAKMVGAKIVYVSTDAVFPNSSTPHPITDKPKPESVYGHSKYFGELAVQEICDEYIIARTSWIFGGGKEKDKKFVAKFIAQLDAPEVKAVDDQFSSPTYAKDLVESLKSLIIEDKKGIFHIVNSGVASRHDMALIMASTLKKKPRILSVRANTFGLKSYQQSSGGLLGNVYMRPWQESLRQYIETEWS